MAKATGQLPQNVNFAIRSSTLSNFLEAHQISYEVAAKGEALPNTKVAERASAASVQIRCLADAGQVLSNTPPTLASPSPGTFIPLPAPSAVAPQSTDQLYDEAIKKLKEGDYAGAEKGFKAFVQRYPQHALAGNAQYWLGETFYARRDYQNAMTAFAEGYKTYKSSPHGPANLLKLGVTLAVLGRKPDACAVFSRFSQDYPRATDLQKQRIEQERQKNGCV